HDRLKAAGACFGEVSGWERANWFLPKAAQEKGLLPRYEYSWKRQNWFDYSADEHRAVRETVGMFDMSSFGKIKVVGRDAEAVLQRIAANDVAVAPGKIVYTQFLNEAGNIEADVTIARLSADEFLVVTPAATVRRDLHWINGHIPDTAHAFAIDVTVAESVLVVMGPEARDFLSPLIPQSLSNEAFPFGTMQNVEIGHAMARAHRVTYVGELGWELYVSSEMANHVFDTIMTRAKAHPLRLCGLHALDSCRIEKAFRHFGHDISSEDHVLEAGLGFAVKENKSPGKFGQMIGRDAVAAKRNDGLSQRLMQFRLTDPDPLLYHNEAILQDGAVVGYLTSGNYGHHLGGAVGLGYVKCRYDGETAEAQLNASYAIDVAGKIVEADVSFKPMYDPKAAQVRL
ncbi:aminomethyltransferase family protein, partial [bacterium]|nr:aminomethyltransferase family protein [bacterium]